MKDNPDIENILKVKNVNFSYDGVPVLNDLSFAVRKGSFISILGPNGSGKSTLINLLSKVLKGYTGSIEIFGNDLRNLNPRNISKLISVVPQYSNPGFDFTVEEMVLMGRFPYISRFGREKHSDFLIAGSVMEKTGITDLAGKKFNELSGGEKQRVVIAQTLVQDTPIILLDEPTSHLDINFQIEMMELFYGLNRDEGKTVIGVFHDINLASNYSRTAIFLRQGKIYASGETGSVITRENIRNVFKSDVYVGKNPFTGKLYVSPTFAADTPEDGDGGKEKNINIKIHVIGGGGAASPILNLLYNKGYMLTCGVVNNFDTDLDTAKMLGISYISEAPFSPISLYSANKNLEFIKASDIVILPSLAFGHGNFSNLVSVKEAIDMGKKVIVVTGEAIADRDYTDGKSQKLYEKILEKNVIIIDNIQKIPELL
jgi:iron complex transport system ATP-binding protein